MDFRFPAVSIKTLAMKQLFTALTLLLFPLSSFAGFATKAEVGEVSDEFMTLVEAEKYNEAFALLKPDWPVAEEDYQTLKTMTAEQMVVVKNGFGAVTGAEWIRTEEIGESYIRLTYLQKFEKHALKWVLVYYNPADEWLVNQVSWDDNIDTLFTEN